MAPNRWCMVGLFALFASGCSHADSSGQSSPGPSAGAAATDSAGAAASGVAASPLAGGVSPAPATTSSGGATPAATTAGASAPAASPRPQSTNLFSYDNGTILRSYPEAIDKPGQLYDNGNSLPASVAGPLVFVYELPGVADLTAFYAELPQIAAGKNGVSVTFATSTTSANGGFTDQATIVADDKGGIKPGPAKGQARWIRVTVNTTDNTSFVSIAATGKIEDRPSGAAPLLGGYAAIDGSPYANGAFQIKAAGDAPEYMQVVGTSGSICNASGQDHAFRWTSVTGRTYAYATQIGGATVTGHLVLNDEGTVLTGADDGGGMRTFVSTTIPQTATFCYQRDMGGKGKTNVLVLDRGAGAAFFPVDGTAASVKAFPNLHFSRLSAPMVTDADLRSAQYLILAGVCDADSVFSPDQRASLLSWVRSGHTMLVLDSGLCATPGPNTYAFLPYPFSDDDAASKGTSHDGLASVEDNALGTNADIDGYATADNHLGDANSVKTQDPHWCGHLFGINGNNAGGYLQMSAAYGKGVIVYDGLSPQDASIPQHQKIRANEFEINGNSDLPCTRKVRDALAIAPDAEATFVPGQATTLHLDMRAIANQGWKGTVRASTGGDFPGTVSPSSFSLAGGLQPLKISVNVPDNAKPGQYNVVVNADGGGSTRAQATVSLTASGAVAKALSVSKRLRLSDIHFDPGTANIQQRSESAIAGLSRIMIQNPNWKFRIEDYTDSDGDPDDLRKLSQQRAQAVLDDLVLTYYITRTRMQAKGFGAAHPIAPNSTEVGKALNQRVEIVRL